MLSGARTAERSTGGKGPDLRTMDLAITSGDWKPAPAAPAVASSGKASISRLTSARRNALRDRRMR